VGIEAAQVPGRGCAVRGRAPGAGRQVCPEFDSDQCWPRVNLLSS